MCFAGVLLRRRIEMFCFIIHTGQFERTIIIAEEGSSVEYLKGCTAPAYDTNQLHAVVVDLHAATDAEIRYSTVQNWIISTVTLTRTVRNGRCNHGIEIAS